MQYKGIVFDLDGTLLNTIEDLADSVNAVMKHFGFPEHTPNEYMLKIGNGFRNLVEVSLPEDKRQDEIINEGLEIFLKKYDQLYQNKTAPYDGIIEMIHKVSEMGIKIGVNSNKRTDYTRALVQKFFSHIPFVEVYGERAGIPKKPDPVTALEIVDMMGFRPTEVLYIGDSKTDMMTGQNAGMDTVGVDWGFRGRKELEKYGANYIVDKPSEILKIIE